MRKHVKTVVISDLKKIDYQADLIVNGFIGFKNTIAKTDSGPDVYLDLDIKF